MEGERPTRAAVLLELAKPLPKDVIQVRPDGYGYIDQLYVVTELNRIFGFDGWKLQIIEAPRLFYQYTHEVDEWEGEKGNRRKTGKLITNHVVVVTASVRLSVSDVSRDGQGACTAESPIDSFAHSLETAIKGAVTDALKRAAVLLGEHFGLSLYDKQKDNKRPVKPDPKSVFEDGVKQLDAEVAARAKTYLDSLPQCGDAAALKTLIGEIDKDLAAAVIKPLLRPTVEAQKRKLGLGPKRPKGPEVFPNFGRAKGQKIAGAKMVDLNYYKAAAEKSLADPAKANFHDKEKQLLAVIQWEIENGGDAAAEPVAASGKAA